MRIAYFTESLPPIIDGVSHTFVRLAEYLEKNDIDFRFFSPFKPGNDYSWNDNVRKLISIPFPLYREYRLALPILENTSRDLDEYKPELIHCSSPTFLGLFGINYAEKNGLPAVVSYHTHFVSYFRFYGLTLLENWGWNFLRKFHNRFHMTYVPSNSMKSELFSRGFDNIQIWGRGINIQRFSPDHRDENIRNTYKADEKPILLFVGRLVREKNLDDLVLAHSILKKRGYNYNLVIIGDGPIRSELENKMPDAHFLGFQQGVELSRWYASADFFIFPSSTEAFGNVVQEALASGIPAVGVNRGGVSDLIFHGENGFLAEPNNAESFANKISILLNNPELISTLGESARIRSQKYSWDIINSNLIKSYKDIINRHFHDNIAVSEKKHAYNLTQKY